MRSTTLTPLSLSLPLPFFRSLFFSHFTFVAPTTVARRYVVTKSRCVTTRPPVPEVPLVIRAPRPNCPRRVWKYRISSSFYLRRNSAVFPLQLEPIGFHNSFDPSSSADAIVISLCVVVIRHTPRARARVAILKVDEKLAWKIYLPAGQLREP